jgi:hypothetical protein
MFGSCSNQENHGGQGNHGKKGKQEIFQVLTAASVKMAVFWIAALCSLVDHSDDGGSKHL